MINFPTKRTNFAETNNFPTKKTKNACFLVFLLRKKTHFPPKGCVFLLLFEHHFPTKKLTSQQKQNTICVFLLLFEHRFPTKRKQISWFEHHSPHRNTEVLLLRGCIFHAWRITCFDFLSANHTRGSLRCMSIA